LLTDFGLSVAVQSGKGNPTKAGHGTEGYRAPELLDENIDERGREIGGTFSKKSDVWATGCVLFAVATTGTRVAFRSDLIAHDYASGDGSVPELQENDNPNLVQPFPSESVSAPLWVQLNAIIENCFAPKPDARPGTSELLTQFEGIRSGLMD
jgi:serine/threonine protein kinase